MKLSQKGLNAITGLREEYQNRLVPVRLSKEYTGNRFLPKRAFVIQSEHRDEDTEEKEFVMTWNRQENSNLSGRKE